MFVKGADRTVHYGNMVSGDDLHVVHALRRNLFAPPHACAQSSTGWQDACWHCRVGETRMCAVWARPAFPSKRSGRCLCCSLSAMESANPVGFVYPQRSRKEQFHTPRNSRLEERPRLFGYPCLTGRCLRGGVAAEQARATAFVNLSRPFHAQKQELCFALITVH